jgi:16S rRNA (guanine527-N7)-methyltransferase
MFHVKHGPATQLRHLSASMDVEMSDLQAAELVNLVDCLLLEPQNLTAIEDVSEAVGRHLADSVAGLTLPQLAGPRVVDLGSGGGFPGLVIAMLRPDISVTLVESEQRKCEWLRKISTNLPNVRVVADRSESLASLEREAFATVTARAVAPLVPTLELAAPLIQVGGHLLVWATDDDSQDADGARAAEMLGFGPFARHAVTPFPDARRHIVVFPKIAPTSARYPRRPGRATTRPLVGPSVWPVSR